NHNSHKRFTAILFGWTFILIGIYYLLVSIIELRYPDLVFGWAAIQFGLFQPQGITMYDAIVFMMFGLQTGINILTLILAFHLPLDLASGSRWNSAVIGALGVYCFLVPTMVIFGGFSVNILQSIMIFSSALIWLTIYVRCTIDELRNDNQLARSGAQGSGLLLIAFYSPTMIWWLSTVTMYNNTWFSGILASQPVEYSFLYLMGVNLIWVAGVATILTLIAGESIRTFRKGSSFTSVIVFIVALIGFINYFIDLALTEILVSCYETECKQLPVAFDIWSTLTIGIISFLFVPILFVYILVQYKLIDTESDKNRGLLRIMILLLLLILSSSFIELVQSLIPVPQMVTASLLAAVVAFFVGWEEKITSWFVNENEVQMEISGDEISNESIRRLTIMLSSWLVFTLIVSWLFASMEVGV
ncbi:MAG: hypothetical protein CL996_07815, partial [Euryarchaeota archaeon]|nr:hypothetical protein [Euryarchaeota archaeon]